MKAFVSVLTSILLVFAGLVVLAHAEVAGRITQVEGTVDFLKGGKLPASAVKLDDRVEVGDVLRTKSLSKAQITFMDNTVITVSPESRIAIEEYMFDPGKGKRSAVLQLFQGLAHVVVSKLFKPTDPDFVVKTHTAVMGVRGTEVGLRIHPNNTTILNFEGHTEVGNIFPEVGDLLFKKAYKIAFSWGGPSSVHLRNMQGTSVFRGLPPTQPFSITQQDRQQFMGQMGSGLTGRQGTGSGTQTAGGGTSGTGGGSGTSGSGTSSNLTTVSLGGPDSGLGSSSGTNALSNLPTAVITPTTSGISGTGLTANQVITNIITTPTLTSTATTPSTTSTTTPTTLTDTTTTTTATTTTTTDTTSTTATTPTSTTTTTPTDTTTTTTTTPTAQTYTFQATTHNKWDVTVAGTGQSNTVNTTGWAQATAGWSSTPLYYTSSSTTAAPTLVQGTLPSSTTGTASGTLTGSVTGILGSSLTGTGTYTGVTSSGESTTYSGTIVVDSSGQVTFTYTNGTLSSNAHLLSGSGTITFTPGTYIQQSTNGAILRTSISPYTSATSTTTGTSLWAGGSRTGVLPGSFDLTMTGTETSPWRYSYLANELGDLSGTMQGVVSPLTGGGYQGAVTITSSNPDTPFTSSLLPQFRPSFYTFPGYSSNSGPTVGSFTINSDGSASGIAYSTKYRDWRFASSSFNLSQTVPQTSAASSVSAVYNFQEAYNGALMLNTYPMPSANGFGWGQRTFNGTGSTTGTSVYNTYFNSYDNGVWTATAGTLPTSYGSSLTPGSGTTAGTAQITGSASGTLGGTLTGTMTYIGSLLNGASFSYSGPVSISNDGYLTFTYKNSDGYTSSWIYPGGATGTASGTMYQSPGYHFTQSMSGDNFTVTQSSPNNWNISLSNSTSTSGGIRSGVYAGSIGTFTSALSLYSPTSYALPSTLMSGSGTGAVSIDMEGVASYSALGTVSGAATANINLTNMPDQLSLGFVPGTVTLSSGGSFFSPAPVYVQNNTGSALQVTQNTAVASSSYLPQSYLTQTPSYTFSETLQGFRMSTVGASPTLASIEGYAWGQRTGSTALSGSGYNYLSYFVSQDLGTRASASAMSSNILGVSGTLSGTLSGTVGQTLSGQATYTGTNSSGTSFTYQGNVSLAANGQLVFNYGGTWSNPSGQTGTGSGQIQQVPGTYFTETVTGNYQQASNTSGTVNFMSTTNPTPLSGTRTMDPDGANATTTTTTASLASGQSSTVNTLTPASGSLSMTVKGVVAGSAWQSKWGVASISGTTTPTGGTANTRPTTTGPVIIDTAETLTTQSVGTISNGAALPDTLSRNLISVTDTSGLTTSSFATTTTGSITQTATSNGSGKTITTPTALTGTSGGLPISADLNITSTALQPGSYTSGTGTMTVNQVGVVAGTSGGTLTGVSTVHGVKTVGSTTTTPVYVGSTTFTPGSGSTSGTLTTTLSGINSVPVSPVGTGAGATQTGTLTVTK